MQPTPYYDFSGKTALITGASSGLGAEFAKALSAHGCRVLIAARRMDKLQALADQLEHAQAIAMDVSQHKSVQAAFQALEAQGERIDICVNNAGILTHTSVFDDDNSDAFANILQTNVTGLWSVTQKSACHMRQHGIHGSIVNIASVGGERCCRPNLSAYYASKAAVIKLTENLVLELSAHRIRINAILPGVFYTEMNRARLDEPESRARIEAGIPSGRIGQQDELNAALLYFASNAASSYATGSCLRVDGGLGCGQSTIVTPPTGQP